MGYTVIKIPPLRPNELDGLHYWVEVLPGDRGQMHCDQVINGRMETSYTVGSPGPIQSLIDALPPGGQVVS